MNYSKMATLKVNRTLNILMVSLAFMLVSLQAEMTISCSSNQFDCGSGYCILLRQKCDGDVNCLDRSDEVGCNTTNTCNGFQCRDGKCIPRRYKCDYDYDCEDGLDEKECEVLTECHGYQCHSGDCLQMDWKCDGVRDCYFGEDEHGCSTTSGPICSDEHFKCLNGKCLEVDWKCNGRDDCGDGSDEDASVCTKEIPSSQNSPNGGSQGRRVGRGVLHVTISIFLVVVVRS